MAPKSFATAGLLGLALFMCVAILYPNPFGNNPDILADESYFLTSSLSAIEKGTLPGWEFSHSGSYYGGVQTYLDTLVLVPALAGVFITQHFSIADTKLWVALHTGDLLHLLRLTNGVLALSALLWGVWYFRRRAIPRPLALTLGLFVLLILSNDLAVQFFHTAKIWTVYVLIASVLGGLLLAQEYYLRHLGRPFLAKERWVAVLVWGSVLVFFQNYFGIFTTGLFGIYVLVLGHFTFNEVFAYLKRTWYWIGLFALTQISFMYRAVFINGYQSFADLSARAGADQHLDWHFRLIKPLYYLVESQPLSVLYAGAVLFLAYILLRSAGRLESRARMYLLIAAVHPVLTYLFFHIAIGFNVAPRYGIILGTALPFSLAIFAGEMGKRVLQGTLVLAGALAAVVLIHAIPLYWQQSSEKDLLALLSARYDSPENVFIEDDSALRLTLPTNAASLTYLDEKRAAMSRFEYLLAHAGDVPKMVSFKPITILTYSDAEREAAIRSFATSTKAVWVVNAGCENRCTAAELAAGSCVEVHTSACPAPLLEISLLPVYLGHDQLGNAYTVRRVH